MKEQEHWELAETFTVHVLAGCTGSDCRTPRFIGSLHRCVNLTQPVIRFLPYQKSA